MGITVTVATDKLNTMVKRWMKKKKSLWDRSSKKRFSLLESRLRMKMKSNCSKSRRWRPTRRTWGSRQIIINAKRRI